MSAKVVQFYSMGGINIMETKRSIAPNVSVNIEKEKKLEKQIPIEFERIKLLMELLTESLEDMKDSSELDIRLVEKVLEQLNKHGCVNYCPNCGGKEGA